MKKLLYFLMIAILFIACSNDEPILYKSNNMLVKDPKVLIYEGGTRSADPNRNMWDWEPNQVTQEEANKITEWFKTHKDPESISLDWTDFYVQYVARNQNHYTAGNGGDVVGCDHMDNLAAWSEWGDDHINNFNASLGAIMKMVNSSTEKFSYNCSEDGQRHYKFVIVEIDGEYYVGFDFEATGQNPNQKVDADGYYDDWIIKITNANPKQTPEEPSIDTPDNPTETSPAEGKIEVNLHADKKLGDYLESHLSVHVRAATDVEIFIPVPHKYICEADDMAIVMKHEHNHMGHGGPKKYTYILKDSDLSVTLYLDWTDNPEGILIWTEGITQEVIDYCKEKVGDGITFEIWNYFNDEIDLETLKQYLNQSTIKFIDSEPDEYINSMQSENDCTVKKS